MYGNLPSPVEKMLTCKHGMFDDTVYDYRFDGESSVYTEICDFINSKIK